MVKFIEVKHCLIKHDQNQCFLGINRYDYLIPIIHMELEIKKLS